MVTKEELKKEVEKLPDSLLEVVYRLLKNIVKSQKKENKSWTPRNFHGQLDNVDIRGAAYE